MLKLDMVTKVIFFIIILTTTALSNCKDYSNPLNDKIDFIEIKVHKEKKFVAHVSKYYLSQKKGKSLTNFNKKKKYGAKITVNYNSGNYCTYEAKLRMHGDGVDHVDLINGIPISSLNIKLKEGNIKNITRFILFKPNSRNYANEIFAANLLTHLEFLSPRTFKIKVKMFNSDSEFIFQESLKKEFLEHNNKVEGPILESKEDFNNSHLEMAKISNKEWIKENKNKYIISLNAIRDYNLILLKSYKFRILAKDETVRFDPHDFDEKVFEKISIFDAIMYAIGGAHGLSYDDRRFYYDPIYSQLEPIYFDGDVNILSKIKYDKQSGKIKNSLQNWQIIKKPFLNFYLNETRDDRMRFGNPTVTNSAKNGSSSAILMLKNINTAIFLETLHNNGFKNISIKELNFLISHMVERLKLIAEAKVYKEKIKLEKSLYFNFRNEMKIKNDLNLIFISKSSSLSNKKEISIEECDYSLNSCESYIINEKKLMKLIDQKKLSLEKSIFVNFDKKDYAYAKIQKSKNNIRNNFNSFKINELFEVYINKDVSIFLDKKNKIIKLNYLSNEGRAIIFDSKIDSWTIQMNNLSKKINNEFDNKYNLTGCLTIIDSLLNNVNISGKGFNCEDTINFIRSSGYLNNIQIKNSRSDSVDADFSQLKFNFLSIEKSTDDCLDFSYGTYNIENANLKNCGDKAISVGEKSKATFGNIEIQDSNIGVASKDSSDVYIDKVNMKNLKVCLSAYKKKQEFDGSFLEVNNFKCEAFDDKFLKDSRSTLVIKNEL
jgi:hypothetical protein